MKKPLQATTNYFIKSFFLFALLLFSLKATFGNNDKKTGYRFHANQAGSTTVLSTGSNPSCIGSNLTLTATVSPTLVTGTVEFFDGAVSLGTSLIIVGTATLTTSSLTAGTHSLTAIYSGDITYTTSTSAVVTQVINAGIPPTPGSVSGITAQCPSVIEQIYSIATIADVTTYNWTVPAGWSITNGAGTETISVTTGTTGQNGNITVTASNSCGTGAAASLAVTVGPAAPAMPGAISGNATTCPGIAGLIYSISAVANATVYNWSVPATWTITAGAGTNSITVTSGTAGGNITVSAGNNCGNSAAQTKPVTVNPGTPATPGIITGTTPVCPNTTGLVYSIAAVTNATSYTWAVPAGWTITAGAGTISITVTAGAVGGNITVAAVNSCGSSNASQSISISPVNATNNTGYTDGTTKSSDLITTGTTAPEKRGYLKFPLSALPAGVTVTASVLKITNNGSASSGAVSYVRALGANDPVSATAASLFAAAGSGANYNASAWSATGQLSLTLLAAANTDISGSITSPGYIAMGLARSSANMYNFYGYSGGANSPLLNLTYASVRSFAVVMNPAIPATPGTISGGSGACPASTGNVYSIAAVTNASSYNWTIPAGWTITSGAGTTSITVTAGVSGGNISVTAANTCGTSAAQTMAVTVYTLPTVSTTPSSQEKCSGTAINTIIISNPNAVAGTTFTWLRDNTILLTGIAASGAGASISGSLTDILTTQQTTTFTITATANGCASTSPATVTVIVDPNPTAYAGVDQAICTAATTTIGATPAASGGTGAYTYAWTAGVSNTAIANPTAPAGTYTLTVTDTKGCTGTDAVIVTNSSVTKTWIGSGTLGGGPDNNFNNPLNWSPAGVPGACNDVIMGVDVSNILNIFSGALAVNLAADATVKSLTVNVTGTLILSSNTTFTFNVGTHAFTVLNATALNTTASVIVSNPAKCFISVGSGGIVTYGGTLTSAVSSPNLNYPFYAAVNNLGKIYVKGDAVLAGIGNDPANKPSRVIFDAATTQTITNSSGSQALYMGATSTEIGETNSPTVVLAGAGTGGFVNIGDLNINNSSTLDLGATQTMNRLAAGGSMNMSAGTFLKTGKSSGGVGTSNFPSNFSAWNLNATSTVNYNGAAAQSVYASPLYGNLTLSNAGNKTVTANTTAQNNISIQGAAVLIGGTFTIALGGNWSNYGQAGFSEQTSTVDFNGTAAQTINTTGGEIFYTLNKTAAGTTTTLSDVAVQGGGSSSFNLSAGIFDAGVFSFNSAAGSLNISAGLLRLARTGATLLPEFAVSPYNITGGTIELYGAGDQVLRGARAYRNLTFSSSGIKTISSAITSITGTVLTQNSVTLDVSNSSMGGAGTNLSMTGTSIYKTAGTATKPDAQGTYTLGAGTTVEFTNAAATTEDVRLTLPTYYNLVVSGTNVANPSAGTGIKMQAGGTFTVRNGGLFKLGSSAGFSGGSATSVQNTNSPAIVLEDGSTVEYYGAPAGTNPQTITNAVAYSNLIFSGTSVKTAPAGLLTVTGNLTNNNSGFAHNNGTVLLNGTAVENYNSTGTTLTWYNMTAANTVNVNINNDLQIAGLLSLSTAGKLNLGGGNITLKSGAISTASVDKINVSNSISYSGTGRFIVERFIPTGLSHAKSWQFLATPAFGQTVNAGWQEGNAPLIPGTAGLGTTISSEKPGATARGYDFYTAVGPSIKTYNAVTNAWDGIDDGVTATTSLPLANPKGYMLFVRGDRYVQTSSTAANVTTLRTTGKLYSPGTDAPASVAVAAGRFGSAGNPYASAISFSSLFSSSAGIDNKYYVWDPLLPGSSGFGYGGYQLLSSINSWFPVPGGTVNYPTGTAYTKIQSGQAFFVYSTPGGSLNFTENNKITGNQPVFRSAPGSQRQFLRSYLFGETGLMADGNVLVFSNEFSSGLDADDAIKILNLAENFSIFLNDKQLALEASKPVVNTDTIFYRLGNLHAQTYLLKFAPSGMPSSMAAFLIDTYTGGHSGISLTDSSFINFTVSSDPASSAADRFYIIFRMIRPVHSTTVEIAGNRRNDSMSKTPVSTGCKISVYPNPVAGKLINVYFSGQQAGNYNVLLNNETGQVVFKTTISIGKENTIKSLKPGRAITAGNYRLAITAPGGEVLTEVIVIE